MLPRAVTRVGLLATFDSPTAQQRLHYRILFIVWCCVLASEHVYLQELITLIQPILIADLSTQPLRAILYSICSHCHQTELGIFYCRSLYVEPVFLFL